MSETGEQHRLGGGRRTAAPGDRRAVWCLEVQGRRVELRQGETTVGRSRGSGVVIKDPAVSRGHALVTLRGDRVTVRDLRSSNGTYLNGRRVEAETPMAEGDRLTVGETQVYLRLARDGGARPAPEPAGMPPAVEALPVGQALDAACEALDLTSPPGLVEAAREGRLPPAPSPPQAAPEIPQPPPASAADAPSLTAAAVSWRPAGFWVRAAAWLLDAAAVTLAGSMAALPFGGPGTPRGSLIAMGAAFVLGLVVPLVGWSLWGTTPGKRALGLVVVGPGDHPGLPLGRALLRLLGYFLSTLPFGAGFWIAGISPEKRGLHDHLAGTSVLRGGR
jgi:uncharacterized RDD family membrane protein YckC